jgi:hypothetical protein
MVSPSTSRFKSWNSLLIPVQNLAAPKQLFTFTFTFFVTTEDLTLESSITTIQFLQTYEATNTV